MEGLELAALFSSAPNALGLCGPSGFDTSDKKRLLSQMKKFRAPYAYLSLIAKANNRKPFDYGVVEAFWLGNDLLANVPRAAVARMIKSKFTGNGRLSKSRAKILADNLPEQVYPHHSFHVFYIGSISGYLEGKKKELDLCRVSWGNVTRVGKGKLAVCSKPVKFENGSAVFGKRQAASWATDGGRFAAGGIACSHWGRAIIPITAHQKGNLEKFTKINMALYAARPKAW